METSGITPPVGLQAPDLAPLFHRPGPFLSVYLATEADVENAAQRSERRWRTLRKELADAGIPEAVLVPVDPLVPDAHLEGECLAVVATEADGVVRVEHHDEPPSRDVGRWANLPSVGPLLEWRQSFPSHVVVLVDRRGAEVFGVQGDVELHEEVEGAGYPLARSKPRGWSQRHHQQRVENTWEHNAEAVAKEVARMAEQVGARIVVAAGDERALSLLEADLAKHVVDRLHLIGGVGEGDDWAGEVAEEVVRLVATAAAEDTVALLRKLKEELGQGDRAANGPSATLAALAAAQVEVLLVHDDPDDTRTAWFGPQPTHVADRPDVLADMGVERSEQGRLVDVLLRAALGTGAAVRVIPSAAAVQDGVAAILRWSTGAAALEAG